MDIIKQIDAKNKAFDVIDSCETKIHYETAENYIELYFSTFEDMVGYNELLIALNKKKECLV
jgi:hypothetical protein